MGVIFLHKYEINDGCDLEKSLINYQPKDTRQIQLYSH